LLFITLSIYEANSAIKEYQDSSFNHFYSSVTCFFEVKLQKFRTNS